VKLSAALGTFSAIAALASASGMETRGPEAKATRLQRDGLMETQSNYLMVYVMWFWRSTSSSQN
jgi:hypothetical protein